MTLSPKSFIFLFISKKKINNTEGVYDLKKGLFFLMLLLFLNVMTFAIPEIIVSESSLNKEINIEMKLYRLKLDQSGHILNFELYDSRAKKYELVYEYTGDSYDILDTQNMTEILPSTYNIRLAEDQSFIELNYFFPNGGQKIYKFYNDPNYHFDVQFKNLNGYVVLPSISFSSGIRLSGNIFVSYIDKSVSTGEALDYTLAIYTPEEIEFSQNQYLFPLNYSDQKIISYLGPTKKIFIKETFDGIEEGNTYSTIIDLMQDLGKFGPISNIFYWFVTFFWWLFKVTGNFGWAIILFTLIVNAILFPVYGKQKKSMIEMKQLQPELDKIKKKYKNPQKQQEETMKLYKEKGMNPAGGCLTSLIPLPIMIILWQVIYYFEGSYAYNRRFLLWTDLSQGGFQANFFLLLIAIIASLINALLMSQDARSAWTSVIMSVVFPFILIGLPVGVFVYYSLNMVIQTLLTFVYNRIYNVKGITIRQLVGLGPKPVRR